MTFILIIVFCASLQIFLPWWIIGPVCFAISFWRGISGKGSFNTAFLAVFCLWSLVALAKTIPNNHLLANKIGILLSLPPSDFSWVVVLLLSSIFGGLAAGFSGMAGFYFRRALQKTIRVEEQ